MDNCHNIPNGSLPVHSEQWKGTVAENSSPCGGLHEQANRVAHRRRQMVAAVRQHQSIRTVARHFGVSTSTVAYWVQRAKGQRLDRVDWADHSRAPHHTQRTVDELEERVLG